MDSTIKDVKINSSWIFRATVIFFGSSLLFGILTFLNPAEVEQLFYGYFDEIEQIGEQIFSTNPLVGTLMLFWNNFMAAMVMMLLGIIVAIPTFFALAMNGGALGVLAPLVSLQGENPFLLYLFGIVPHGIFEIPAILIAGGLGLKIGFQLIFPPPNFNRWASIKNNYNQGIKLLPGIISLLAMAAVVEIFVTPLLLSLTIGY